MITTIYDKLKKKDKHFRIPFIEELVIGGFVAGFVAGLIIGGLTAGLITAGFVTGLIIGGLTAGLTAGLIMVFIIGLINFSIFNIQPLPFFLSLIIFSEIIFFIQKYYFHKENYSFCETLEIGRASCRERV